MRDGQDKPSHRRRSKSHAALGLQAAALQKCADVHLIVMVMCGLHIRLYVEIHIKMVMLRCS